MSAEPLAASTPPVECEPKTPPPSSKASSLNRGKRLDLLNETLETEQQQQSPKSNSLPKSSSLHFSGKSPAADIVESLSQTNFQELLPQLKTNLIQSTLKVSDTISNQSRETLESNVKSVFEQGLTEAKKLATPDRIKKVKDSINYGAAAVEEYRVFKSRF